MIHPGGLTEPVQLDHCRHCGQPVLRAHTDAIPVTADPAPLDIRTELVAILTGRSTYELIPRAGGHLELHWRHLDAIRANRGRTVVASHRCPPGPRLSSQQIRSLPLPVRLTTRRRPQELIDEPSF